MMIIVLFFILVLIGRGVDVVCVMVFFVLGGMFVEFLIIFIVFVVYCVYLELKFWFGIVDLMSLNFFCEDGILVYLLLI